VVHEALEGRFAASVAEQLRLGPLHRALSSESNPIPVKAALALLGRCGGELRLPLTPLAETLLPPLRAALLELGELS
jgi:4-hydroxy-tetrahydrodipicolinate synthase